MHITYVVSTMVFRWREHPLSFEQECEYLKSLGFGVELWPTVRGQTGCRYERRHWPRLQAATHGMVVSMRGRTDKPTLDQWAEQIECAKMLKANIVTDLEGLDIAPHTELDGANFAAQVVRMADASQVRLCLETGPLPTIMALGKRFESLGYCLDTGHANIDRTYSFKEYVDELAPRIAHLHLTDNYGQADDHEPPGLQGGISREKWDYLLNALDRYDHEIIGSLEMCPCTPGAMIRRASEFLFDTLKWPNPPPPAGGVYGYGVQPGLAATTTPSLLLHGRIDLYTGRPEDDFRVGDQVPWQAKHRESLRSEPSFALAGPQPDVSLRSA